jgi:hypothetical protein
MLRQHLTGSKLNSKNLNNISKAGGLMFEEKIRAQVRDELLMLEQIEEDTILSLDQTMKVQINTTLLNMLEEGELYWLRYHERWLHEGVTILNFSTELQTGGKERTPLSHSLMEMRR